MAVWSRLNPYTYKSVICDQSTGLITKAIGTYIPNLYICYMKY